METLTLTEAKSKRTHIKAAGTRLKTFLDGFRVEEGSRYEIIERKHRLTELWTQFESIQSIIEAHENAQPSADKDALLAQQIQHREGIEFSYFALMARFNAVLEQFDAPVIQATTPPETNRSTSSRENHVRLPKIDLPVFSGSYEDWYSYQDTFEKLIHSNGNLATIEKFHYLRSSLKEKAAEVIKSIETTTDNYDEAWAAVKELFDNKRWIVQRHIRAIFETPAIAKENHIALRELLDTILKHVRALRALKRPTEAWDDLLIHIIISKLDAVTSKAWETTIIGTELPNLKTLTEFLSRRCQALEAINCRSNAFHTSKSIQMQGSKYKNSPVANIATSNLSCVLCKQSHQLYHCDKFVKLPVDERMKVVKKAHLCLNCLRSASRQAKLCTSSLCRKCSGKHNTLLHIFTSNNSEQVSESAKDCTQSNGTLPVSTQCVSSHLASNVLLSTAVVHVYDTDRQVHPCRVLLDGGSQTNLITQEFVDRLRLEEKSRSVSVAGVMEGIIHSDKVVKVNIKSRFNNFRESIECVVLPKITQRLPQQHVPIQAITIPKNIKLADPNFHIPANIDMLIGAELFWTALCAGQIKYSKTQPVLQKTHFGWVISGCTPNAINNSIPRISCHAIVSDDLSYLLNRFWEVEHNISVPQRSAEERACDKSFLETVRRNEKGRYIVNLPVKQAVLSKLGDSRETAVQRFKATEARLISQPSLYNEYKAFMKEYCELGHMREISNGQVNDASVSSFYLPHHAVKNETSTTTKLRVVFDGSAKTSTGISLNEALMIGPTLQEDLFSILIRFRSFKIAITADITKMYRQVLVSPDQTALQRIVWRSEIGQPIRTYELLTVTYGTSSASFLAIRALRKLAEDHSAQYPLASKITLRDFYVDDPVSGADTIEEASQMKEELNQLLKEGGFELRKWASNIPSLRENQHSHISRKFTLSMDKSTETRALGLTWNCSSDSFKFSDIGRLALLERPTKRSILARIALIFDPLGLLGPTTVVAKILMQELWRIKSDWDESIPLSSYTKWKQYEVELQEMKNISIPRLVISEQPARLELHGFADASECAYGACIYVRSTSTNGEHTVSLLCSKSRVAPLKSISIPRLELCAALLSAQLMHKILNCLPCKIDAVWLWTDSTIVLLWLQSYSRSWTSFVANRVGEIQQLLPIQYWRHVSSKDNPADPLSRGLMPKDFLAQRSWWTGPQWLIQDAKDWPQGAPSTHSDNVPERRVKTVVAVTTTSQNWDMFTRFSKFTKLIRVVAYIIRFARNARRAKSSTKDPQVPAKCSINSIQPITQEEQAQVILRLIKCIQGAYFAEELEALAKQNFVSKQSHTLKLNPFIDETGVLRVGGRIQASSQSFNATHPILLPGHHPFSRLLVLHAHESHLHPGAQATLAAVRQQYWLISARDVVRQIVRKCIICFRSAPNPASTIMGNLPSARVNVPVRPFDKCGVDYAGPFYHKEGSRRNTKLIKCYMAIFVCMATKAVYIELAVDLSSDAFLNTFKWFIARRGCPSEVFSDNGLNFVGAERQLRELAELLQNPETQKGFIEHAATRGIRWHFIPPRAPHHGGLWEAAVKIAKTHLFKITKNAHLRWEELETLLIQIEAILNSRPITPISSDPRDIMCLTPGHFLVGTPLTTCPEESLEALPVNRLSRWQHIQQLRQHFWRRWSREYLHLLQQRGKWRTPEFTIKPGQLVFLIEDNTPPLSWHMGRICEVHPGEDGVARSATVRTAGGTYKRPITRLCPLPINDDRSTIA